MRQHDHSRWHHSHRFETGLEASAERRTRWVLGLTLTMMVVEIVAGYAFQSMALLADGWHMSTHAAAMGIAAFAYRFARRKASSPEFAFGTGKVGSLAGYTSAIILAAIALLVVWQSAEHLLTPETIAFDEAIPIAVVGLLVNIVSAGILGGGHDHDHGHDHNHDHQRAAHGHHDHGPAAHTDQNLRAAYVHVLADALTSVFAIAALLLGRYAGLVWLDPVMGIVGAGVIVSWAYGLLKQSGRTLLDWRGDGGLESEVRTALEREGDNEIADLHIWPVGPGHYGVIATVVTHQSRDPDHYKELLKGIDELSHVTIEVQTCAAPPLSA
jgi:cation diffusion facilitator family transporter